MKDPPRRPDRRFMRAIKWVLLGLLTLFVGTCTWGAVDMIRGPRVFEHISAQDAPRPLPPDATDVCYVTRPAFGPWSAMEFTVSEESFVVWARANKHELKEIAKPFSIRRYKPFVSDGPWGATISEGLFCEEPWGPDSGVQIAYDRRLRRAYYYVAFR